MKNNDLTHTYTHTQTNAKYQASSDDNGDIFIHQKLM